MDSSSFLYRLMNFLMHNYTVCVNNTYCSWPPVSCRCWVHWEPAAVQLCCYSWCCCVMRLEAVTRKASLPPICSHSVCVCVCVRVLEHVKTPCVLSPLESHGTGKIIITYKKWNLQIKFVLYYFSPLCSHQGNLFSTWPWWTFVHLMDFKRVFVILKTV